MNLFYLLIWIRSLQKKIVYKNKSIPYKTILKRNALGN